jgi:hypothetical protein
VNVYQKGDLVRIDGLFTNLAGAPQDPSTVSLKVTKPSGTTTTEAYNPGNIVKDATGTYHLDVNANEAGRWFYSWISTGTGQAAENGEFLVDTTQ